MRYSRVLALCLLFVPAATVGAQVRQTGHPHESLPADSAAILAARSAFQWVEAALKKGELARSDTTVECENMPLPVTVSLYRDVGRVVRLLREDGGTDHQATTTSYYYDEVARLRFAFFEQNTDNGTRFEERVYYGDDGSVVRRLRKLVRGPGWSSHPVQPAPDPIEYLHRFCES